MTIAEKLAILSDSAKYDASCASSGSDRKSAAGFGSTSASGICHSWSSDGRCISLLKILLTNICVYDCSYCINRCGNDVARAAFTPEEIVQLTVDFYRRNYIEGLFLSSAVVKDPDTTMELLLRTVRLLRRDHAFGGYIHLKVIPGASQRLIDEAALCVDRISVNVEFATRQCLAKLAPQKRLESIMVPMSAIGRGILAHAPQRGRATVRESYAPAGQSTQLIIGATPETDMQILRLSEALYRSVHLKRVYYSAYIPIGTGKNLPALSGPPLLREHRLYQADWLMRCYGFTAGEILDERSKNLDLAVDPKAGWALRNMHRFPLEVNRASFEDLLRVPGVGVRSVQKIMTLRKVKTIQFDDLKKLRVVTKRAQYFLTVNGKYHGDTGIESNRIRRKLIGLDENKAHEQQLTFGCNMEQSVPQKSNNPAGCQYFWQPTGLGRRQPTELGWRQPTWLLGETAVAAITGEL
jgi:putative DNA modification/repair radical SAM protein